MAPERGNHSSYTLNVDFGKRFGRDYMQNESHNICETFLCASRTKEIKVFEVAFKGRERERDVLRLFGRAFQV